MDISNKTIVLIGATGGIGRAFAKALAATGAQLLLVARNQNQLDALTKQLVVDNLQNKLSGKKHLWLSADITTGEGRQSIINKANDIGADLLINNAGISQFDALNNITEADFQTALDINLMAPICLTRAFLQPMPSEVGSSKAKTVVNVGSALGSIGLPFYSSYCASKFGLRGFTESLQRELALSEDNILYLAPRATQTAINSEAVNAMNKKLGNGVDSPEAVAAALIAQLSSDSKRVGVGWPEKLFARINGLLPELVDKALSKQLTTMRQFVS